MPEESKQADWLAPKLTARDVTLRKTEAAVARDGLEGLVKAAEPHIAHAARLVNEAHRHLDKAMATDLKPNFYTELTDARKALERAATWLASAENAAMLADRGGAS